MTAMQFQGFKPQAMERIAGTLGYQGDMGKFKDFLQSDPEAQMKFNDFQNKAIQMMNGGMVRKNYANGGQVTDQQLLAQPMGTFLNPSTAQSLGIGTVGNAINNYMLPSPSRVAPATTNMASGLVMVNADGTRTPVNQTTTTTPATTTTTPATTTAPAQSIGQTTVNRMQDPRIPIGGVATATGTVAQGSQDLAAGAGQVGATSPTATATQGTVAQATAYDPRNELQMFLPSRSRRDPYEDNTGMFLGYNPNLPISDTNFPQPKYGEAVREDNPALQMGIEQGLMLPRKGIAEVDPTKTAGTVEGVLDKTQTPTGTVSDDAQVTGQQQTETAVSAIDAAQGTALKMDNPVQRELQAGEIIEPAANAAKASQFTEQIQAATATPSDRATVKGQLDTLMADFEGGETPAWAAGALRNATAQMAARGLGASSMAGQALVQAAMESALPIASADAQTVAGFEIKNLSNRQERAMLSAQQRATFMGMEFDQAFQSRVANAAKVSDIANMNFTAEQQVALENSRAANTMNLSNLSNRQALTMAEASSLANLDMANLSNRQAAAVMNAQSFLAMDMTNLANQQQTEMFKAQQRTQSMFTDQAAENAAKQFNATSENQSDQFFANLKTQTSQFNTTQANAMAQFNAGEENAVNKFNTEIANQRDQFNAQNGLVIAQSNAVWRREIATAATAAVNRANEINAAAVLDMSNQAYSNLWQEHADMMEWAWTSSDNERDRQNAVTLSNLAAGRERSQSEYAADISSSSAIGDFVSKLALGYAGKAFGLSL